MDLAGPPAICTQLGRTPAWPGEVPDHPSLGGYQQMLSDIFRDRYRVEPARPEPLAPGTASAVELPVVATVPARP